MSASPILPPLEVYLLGLVDFVELQQLQRRMVYELGEQGGATLILCEHPPTISVGRSGSRAHIVADDEILRGMGIKVHWVNRGGGCVLHVPGQISAYLALSLDQFGLSLRDYLDRLNAAIVGVLKEFDIPAAARDYPPGIFAGPGRIASVGVAVNRLIAYHGLTLNVGPFLELFEMIEERGTNGMPVRQTSMEARRQRHTSMPKVREALIRHLEQSFAMERHHLYTHHPLIRRKVAMHVYAPSPG